MTKPGRNDPCPCGSGKKYKKCCEKTVHKGRFTAHKIETPKTTQINPLASIFQANVQATNATLQKDPASIKPIGKKESKKTPKEGDNSSEKS